MFSSTSIGNNLTRWRTRHSVPSIVAMRNLRPGLRGWERRSSDGGRTCNGWVFFKIPDEVAARRDLGPGPILLYGKIKHYADIEGNGVAWPGIRKLARQLGTYHPQVIEWAAKLVECGLIEVEVGTGRRTNRYRILPCSGTETIPQGNPSGTETVPQDP